LFCLILEYFKYLGEEFDLTAVQLYTIEYCRKKCTKRNTTKQGVSEYVDEYSCVTNIRIKL